MFTINKGSAVLLTSSNSTVNHLLQTDIAWIRELRRLQGGLGTSNMLQFYIISNAELLLYLYEWIEKYDFELNRVFFKILSSHSFFKGKWLWVLKSNMADKTSYCLYFPAITARFVKKTVPIRMLLN